jgi:cell division GTPase FtsZ
VIRRGSTDDTNIIFGATIDERLAGQMWVTVIATGLRGKTRARRERPLFGRGEPARNADELEPPSFLQDL